MTNPVFEAAKTFAANWTDAGFSVGDITFSENRYGQFSAYLDVAHHGRFRVSDHSHNENFATERTVHYTNVSAEAVANFIRIDTEANAAAADKQAEKNAERDAFEAPFKARYLAAKEHERHAIVCEMHPWLAGNKAARKEIITRWTKG